MGKCVQELTSSKQSLSLDNLSASCHGRGEGHTHGEDLGHRAKNVFSSAAKNVSFLLHGLAGGAQFLASGPNYSQKC